MPHRPARPLDQHRPPGEQPSTPPTFRPQPRPGVPPPGSQPPSTTITGQDLGQDLYATVRYQAIIEWERPAESVVDGILAALNLPPVGAQDVREGPVYTRNALKSMVLGTRREFTYFACEQIPELMGSTPERLQQSGDSLRHFVDHAYGNVVKVVRPLDIRSSPLSRVAEADVKANLRAVILRLPSEFSPLSFHMAGKVELEVRRLPQSTPTQPCGAATEATGFFPLSEATIALVLQERRDRSSRGSAAFHQPNVYDIATAVWRRPCPETNAHYASEVSIPTFRKAGRTFVADKGAPPAFVMQVALVLDCRARYLALPQQSGSTSMVHAVMSALSTGEWREQAAATTVASQQDFAERLLRAMRSTRVAI